LSAQNGHLDIVEFLVNHGADINEKNNKNESSLHLSAQNGHLNLVEFLINHGADINQKNNNFLLLSIK